MVEGESQVVVWVTQNQTTGTELTSFTLFYTDISSLTSLKGIYSFFIIITGEDH